MKKFRIVKYVGGEGEEYFLVQHLVRVFGLNLWWSNAWRYRTGAANYTMKTTTEEEAKSLLACIKEDYKKKKQRWKSGVIIQEHEK